MRGCSGGADNNLDDTEFSKPLPWIGLYVAAASLICAIAMSMDAYRGFLKRNLWFPSKYFSLNATTLTLLGIATKLPVDLNTPMPRSWDQLTKLSGTVLICTAMGNLMPSLGVMGSSDIVSNVIALAIFVITVIVNVTIQMVTGVIYVYLPEHALIMLFMLVLLVLLISSALIVPTTKLILNRQFDMRYNDESDENDERVEFDKFDPRKLKEYVRKFWVMAHTSSPQYVIGRSATCTASGAFCLVSALILTQAIVRSFVWKSVFCGGSSDYDFATAVVLIIQTLTVAVGTIAPAVRWFSAVRWIKNWRCKQVLKVEKYWIQRLQEWKEDPSSYLTASEWLRWVRKRAHELKILCLDVSVVMQKGVVMVSKVVRMMSVVPVSWVAQGANLVKILRKLDSNTSSVTNIDFSHCVLHLEGESDLVGLMMRSERKDTDMWIDRGNNNKPVELAELIQQYSSISQGFKGVGEFDKLSDNCDDIESPPHCWALPVVTLASIAVALPGVDRNSTKLLLKAVSQGLRYVRLVEKNLDDEGLVNMRDAADAMWLQLDLYHKWYNVDLHTFISTEEKKDNGGKRRNIIEKLEKIAQDRVSEFHSRIARGEETERGHLEWPGEVLAAHCMHRICTTILSNYDAYNKTNDDLFVWIRKTIADILGACLTNLPRVIYMECFCCAIEVREQSVRAAAFLLGEAEELLRMLRDPEVACFYPENKEHIREWRNRTSPGVV